MSPQEAAEMYASTRQVKDYRLAQLEKCERVVNRIRADLVLTSDSDVADEVNRLLLHADKATRRVEDLEAALRDLIAAFTMHRSDTHRVEPMLCITCQRSTEALKTARRVLG